MRLRVDELAARAGVSVDTVRFYQTRGLVPPPAREGRTAWYSGAHLDRLDRIRALKEEGFSLASIARFLDGELDRADEALVGALVSGPTDGGAGRPMTLAEMAAATGVSPALLQAIEREGLLAPDDTSGERRYSQADARAVKAGLALLEAGLPLSELLSLARDHDEAMRAIAARAVELFVRFVRDPIRAATDDEVAAGAHMVEAFEVMLPATVELVAGHFRRLLISEARSRAGLGEGSPR